MRRDWRAARRAAASRPKRQTEETRRWNENTMHIVPHLLGTSTETESLEEGEQVLGCEVWTARNPHRGGGESRTTHQRQCFFPTFETSADPIQNQKSRVGVHTD